jgi:DNA invertase Pin-like site-specific DNA recombinase
MCKVYGYCRISTQKQSIERQIRNIKASHPDAIIIEEVYTGTKTDGREKFENLCKVVKEGDTIIFDSVSRMSRNAGEGFSLYQDFFSKGVELVFIKEPQINTATYKEAATRQFETIVTGDEATDELTQAIMMAVNRYMMRLAEKQIRIAFEQAEKEVSDLHQRTKEGIETARLSGKQIGQLQGSKLNVKKEAPAKEAIKKYSKDFQGTLTDIECMKLIGLARNTYYKYKGELKAE